MAIPVNIDAEHAIEITSFPCDITQDVYDVGTALSYTVWYKFTAPVNAVVVGSWGWGGAAGVGYIPMQRPWLGPFDALTWLNIAANNIRIQFPVTVGEEYFLEFVKNANVNPSSLRIRAEIHELETVAIGSIFINDDQEDRPAAILSAVDADNFRVLKFVSPFPGGEQGDVLEGGEILIHDDYESPYDFKLYTNQIVFVQNIGFDNNTTKGIPKCRACHGANCWYTGYTGLGGFNFAIVRRVSNLGVLGSTVYNLGAFGLSALAANNTETILYYSGSPNSTASNIKRWNLTTNVAMSDLVADIGGNYEVCDILYQADDTLVVLYWEGSSTTAVIKNINATTGAILHTYSLGSAFVNTSLPRLAYAIDEPNSFWVFLHPNGANLGKSYIRNIKISDGSTISQVTNRQFEGGMYMTSVQTATPDASFGHSESCPFFILRANAGGGIYVVIPFKTYDELYDENVNIPDPTFKTALLGD